MWLAWRPIVSAWQSKEFCRSSWSMVWRHDGRILSRPICVLFPCPGFLLIMLVIT